VLRPLRRVAKLGSSGGSIDVEGSLVNESFPSAAPEIPVSDVTSAALYYERCLGFHWDWGTDGIGQVSRAVAGFF
jgi:hypothetical protein